MQQRKKTQLKQKFHLEKRSDKSISSRNVWLNFNNKIFTYVQQGFREKYHKDEELSTDRFYSKHHKDGQFEVYGSKHSKHASSQASKKSKAAKKVRVVSIIWTIDIFGFRLTLFSFFLLKCYTMYGHRWPLIVIFRCKQLKHLYLYLSCNILKSSVGDNVWMLSYLYMFCNITDVFLRFDCCTMET